MIIINGVSVSWKNPKQIVVVQSTTESEYIVASKVAHKAAWMKKFIGDLDIFPSIRDPLQIFCDNKCVISLAKEPR